MVDTALTGRDGDGYFRTGIIPISDPGLTIEERLRIRAAHQISLAYLEMTQEFLGRIRSELERFFVPQADTRWMRAAVSMAYRRLEWVPSVSSTSEIPG